MSAVTEHQEAQRATLAARDALSTLNALLDVGDRGVTGADLLAAEAEVTVAQRLEATYLARVQEEQAAANAKAREDAIADLKVSYERTSAELSNAIETTLSSLSDLLTAAAAHRVKTSQAFSATGLGPRDGVPGYGQLLTPTPEEVVNGVIELAYKNIGMSPTTSYPHLLIEPISPFLSQEVH